ncbi:hypothetical protein BDY19DRAFT_74802 [Irpex rosettiformis]|uniref:Uncharacterized protein n=1 Tax=Irpex rosettiformis TaxID=378272 RepID=A0ACB8UP58_9APHY|nr:hypothetical protein BDY19DRAFT_74802 [Irpex rosettiformis]
MSLGHLYHPKTLEENHPFLSSKIQVLVESSRLILPIVLRVQIEPSKTILQLCSSSVTKSPLLTWLLVYVARTLQYVCTKDHSRILTICLSGLSTSLSSSLRNAPFLKHFSMMVQNDQLAEAVIYYSIDGHTWMQERFTHGGLLSCAILLAHKLMTLPTDNSAWVLITVEIQQHLSLYLSPQPFVDAHSLS